MDDRALHQPGARLDAVAVGSTRAPRPPLPRPARHRWGKEVRPGTQDRLRRPRRDPLRVHPSRTPAPRRGEPAVSAQPPRSRLRQRSGPECWTADQLAQFLSATQHLRLHPALHLAAFTGMRRGELGGLRWGDWHQYTHRLSIARSRQVVAGQSVEVAVKTRTSRRCIDLDADTERVLHRWRRRQKRDSHPVGSNDPIFTNTTGQPVHPESLYQMFQRQVRRLDLRRICFHGLRHTHASLLVAGGTPIKVVSERLGHAHPGFTMATYQHVMPGMGAEAAHKFSQLLARHPVDVYRPDSPRTQPSQRSTEPAGRSTR